LYIPAVAFRKRRPGPRLIVSDSTGDVQLAAIVLADKTVHADVLVTSDVTLEAVIGDNDW
jgi:hypothetical protein